jgi:hypothetical protein
VAPQRLCRWFPKVCVRGVLTLSLTWLLWSCADDTQSCVKIAQVHFMRRIVLLVLLAGVAAASVQQPLSTPSLQADTDEYRFNWPIQRVAIIGAGPRCPMCPTPSHHNSPTPPCSGLAAYRDLTEVGLDVRIFERDSVPGGNWHYTEEVPLDAPVPNAPTPIGDFVPSLPPADVELPYSEVFENDGKIQRDHRGPKPIWESLTCNVPSVCWLVKSKLRMLIMFLPA